MSIETIFTESGHLQRLAAAIEYCDARYSALDRKTIESSMIQLPIHKLIRQMQYNHISFEEGTLLMLPKLAYMVAKSNKKASFYDRDKVSKMDVYNVDNKVHVWQEFRQYMELAIKSSKNIIELNQFYEIFHSYIK